MNNKTKKHNSPILLVIFFWVSLLLCNSLHAQTNPNTKVLELKQPVGFCVAPLDECTQDKMHAVTKKVDFDIRSLNGGKNDPITLIYDIPEELQGQYDIAFMLEPQFTNQCVQLDNTRDKTICSERQTLTVPIYPNTHKIFTQNVLNDDIRLKKPIISVGTTTALQAQITHSLTPILVLTGWYLLLALISLLQLLTHRSRFASFCICMMALTMLVRTVTASHYSLAGLVLVDAYMDRVLQFITVPFFGFFAIGFYGKLAGTRHLLIRQSLMFLFAASAVFIWFAPNPTMVSLSLQTAQFLSFIGLICIVPIIFAAIQNLRKREKRVLITGITVLSVGILVDLYHSFFSLSLLFSFGLTSYAVAFETLCMFMLIALRNDAAHKEAELLKQQAELQKAEIQQKNEELLRLDKLKDQFFANVSHELRTPLTGVIGILEPTLVGQSGTKQDSPEIPPALRRSISIAISSARRLSSLINDLLDYTKSRQNQIVLSPVSVSLQHHADLVLTVLQPSIDNRPVKLINSIPKDLMVVRADPDRLQQILFNLLGNAIKFTEQGNIQITAAQIDGLVRIDIKDSGIGIPPEALGRIFMPLEQADASISRKYGGMGLGLSITKSLVEAHGGNISVSSAVGVGTTFSFTLPASNEPAVLDEYVLAHTPIVKDRLAAYNAQMAALPKQEILQTPTFSEATDSVVSKPATNTVNVQDSRPLRILVVDDEPVNRQVLEAQLHMLGHSVTEAADGMEALRYVKEYGPPDLILLDLMMPGMSGYEVLDALRAEYSIAELPVLILSAKAQEKDLVEGFARGASDYIVKPFSFAEVTSRINHHAMLVYLIQDTKSGFGSNTSN